MTIQRPDPQDPRLPDGATDPSGPAGDPLVDQAAPHRAPATLRAYRSDWHAFTRWCRTHARQALPAEPDTIVAWLHDQAATGYAAATIGRRLITIRHIHHRHGHTSPTDTAAANAAWAAVRRAIGIAPRKVAPITIEILHRLAATCDHSLAARRDHALLIVGFAAALRRSEIAALSTDDVEQHPDGLIVTIRRAKSDQHGHGHRLGLPHGTNPDTCPTRTLQAWQHAADLDHGPLFRPIDQHGNMPARHLSGRAIAEIIKRRVAAAGLDPARYSGHSLRAGFATSAAAAGATETAIARQTRHRSIAVLRGYIREGDLFRTNAATTIGL